MAISAQQVKELRDTTGLPMMECKRALEETDGNAEKAVEVLRKRGLKVADKKASRETREGVIGTYVHHDNKLAVMVEVNCETDFVARGDDFKTFVKDICMHIAWANPMCVTRDELDQTLVEKEKEIIAATLTKVPEDKRALAVEGKLAKTLFAQKVLLDQPFSKDDSKTVEQVLKELIGKIRENISIRRFSRMKVGE